MLSTGGRQVKREHEETVSSTNQNPLIETCLSHFTKAHRPTYDMVSTFMDVVVCADALSDDNSTELLLQGAARWILARTPADPDILVKHDALLIGFFALLSITFPETDQVEHLFKEALNVGAVATQDNLSSSGYRRKLTSKFDEFWRSFDEMTHPDHLRYSEPSRSYLLSVLDRLRGDKEALRERYQEFFSQTATITSDIC